MTVQRKKRTQSPMQNISKMTEWVKGRGDLTLVWKNSAICAMPITFAKLEADCLKIRFMLFDPAR